MKNKWGEPEHDDGGKQSEKTSRDDYFKFPKFDRFLLLRKLPEKYKNQ